MAIDKNDAPDGYYAVEKNSCPGCAFEKTDCFSMDINCTENERKDKRSVIFQKSESR